MTERPTGAAKQSDADAKAADESAATKQMAALIELMRQQMEWSMRSERGRREQDLGCAEALETRMRGIEVCTETSKANGMPPYPGRAPMTVI